MNLFLKLFAFIFLISLVSCGGDEEMMDPEPTTDPIPEATASVTFDGNSQTVSSFSGQINDSNVDGWGIRNLEMTLVAEDMGIVNVDIQNVTIQTPGICVRNSLYQFIPVSSECKDILGDRYCNEATIKYSSPDGKNYTSNLNTGTLEITSCDIDSNVVSGVFSGTFNRVGFMEFVTISGEFENVDIEK